ncbi:RNA polymerase sigma factor (sigma54) [Fictibacillus macauensis ZFHKF-1]|uniref:RNA polymerase sigma factor (Sigma54) n=1 Tax=Fictibacillus macauensis ZFHKF-1 TaxID=1196324 RepID=I8UJP6_9BACL|nr:RNA polymerase factor sigma-54 [Fictibacillus macauensis]EIT87038.1 RNA polymerase sigma factor (sigma54) [Fictibacillus macauensis ZFHKF-1]
MELGLFQQQNLSLVMTAELRQAITILQYPSYELNQFLQEQALENPLIELSEPTLLLNNKKKALQNQGSQDWEDIGHRQPARATMHETLLVQATSLGVPDALEPILQYLILNIDDAGYLDVTEEEVKTRFLMNDEQWTTCLHYLHLLEPAGIGARTLRECLLLQLKALHMEGDLSYRIVDGYLEWLGDRKLKQIATALQTTAADVEAAADFIVTLHPRPGHEFTEKEDLAYVYPDLSVIEEAGVFKLAINEPFTPRVQLHKQYEHLLHNKNNKASSYLQEQYQKYVWLQKSLEQRKNTLVMIAKDIIRQQQDFLRKGPEALVPMTLKDVANRIGMHESTVSRAVKNKWIQTPRGVIALKSFFTTKISTHDGESASSKSAKLAIKKLIQTEDKAKPMSDQSIAETLYSVEGLKLSRRTVAKYREEMKIGSSAKRRRYA